MLYKLRRETIVNAETQDTACFEYPLNTAELSTEHFRNLDTRILNTHSTLNYTLLNCSGCELRGLFSSPPNSNRSTNPNLSCYRSCTGLTICNVFSAWPSSNVHSILTNGCQTFHLSYIWVFGQSNQTPIFLPFKADLSLWSRCHNKVITRTSYSIEAFHIFHLLVDKDGILNNVCQAHVIWKSTFNNKG